MSNNAATPTTISFLSTLVVPIKTVLLFGGFGSASAFFLLRAAIRTSSPRTWIKRFSYCPWEFSRANFCQVVMLSFLVSMNLVMMSLALAGSLPASSSNSLRPCAKFSLSSFSTALASFFLTFPMGQPLNPYTVSFAEIRHRGPTDGNQSGVVSNKPLLTVMQANSDQTPTRTVQEREKRPSLSIFPSRQRKIIQQFRYFRTVIGDPVDGIPGIAGIRCVQDESTLRPDLDLSPVVEGRGGI